ncbi:hypothetical protein [Sinosporangium siamense]|uniref:Uncharacterized protein n=1 Tax=Sinosporangium siamense TaxID=1367973 RepID=A0A919V6Y7_9ACTN|nr:hypothetical protein [Sinosporangium siamense]GII92521.1 hypothetical protein Ssi02_27520 [Sinosporangium siamense]
MAVDADDIVQAEPPGGGPRRWIGLAVLSVLIAVPAVALIVDYEPLPPAPVAPTATPVKRAATPPNEIYPKIRKVGKREVVRVVFPDGRRAEISYPARFPVASLGVSPGFREAMLGDDRLTRRVIMAPQWGQLPLITQAGKLRDLTDTSPFIRRPARNTPTPIKGMCWSSPSARGRS